MRAAEVSGGDFVWLVGSLCQLNRIPFDPDLLRRRYSAPHSVVQLIEAARALGFRVGEYRLGAKGPRSLTGMHLPCIAFLKRSPAQSDAPAAEPAAPALIVAANAERVLFFPSASDAPEALNVAAFSERFEHYLLLVQHEESEAPAALSEPSPEKPFGFAWFGKALLKHRAVWRDVLLGSLFLQVSALATPVLTQVIIDKVVVHRAGSTLAVIGAALVMFMLFSAVMSWLRQYLVLHTGNRVDAALGSEVFRHLLRLHLRFFEQRSTGVVVARVHAVETVREFMAGAAVALLLDFPFLIVFVAIMFFYSWQLTLIALAILVLIAGVSAAVTPLFRARLNRQFLLGARNQAFLTEYVSGMETVKALQMEPRLERRYDDYLASYLASGFSTRQVSNSYNVVAGALEQTMTLSILCLGALLVMRNDGFTIGMLVAFQMFASRLSQPMLRLAGLWQEFQQASIAVKRLGDIMDAPSEPFALVPSRTAHGSAGIELRDLSFRYSAARPYVCRNLAASFPAGRLTVVTGPSGSGKSTLAKLLLGFYQPEQGHILIDGRDSRHYSANELRRLFGVVPQETVLFSGTVYENLLAANAEASFEEIVEACRRAEVHEEIERLPRGYQTELGEHGVGLSGGQKQRLAIARAVLKQPRILIFDEATSSLDPETAERFAQTVNKLRGGATIVYIAHQVPKGLQVDGVIMLGAAAR